MKKNNIKTKVLFLIEKPEGDLPCNVFAFFPEERHNNSDPELFTCYAHLGQHSSCHADYAKECKEANLEQFEPLRKELESIGYNLEILNK